MSHVISTITILKLLSLKQIKLIIIAYTITPIEQFIIKPITRTNRELIITKIGPVIST